MEGDTTIKSNNAKIDHDILFSCMREVEVGMYSKSNQIKAP